MTAAVTAGVEEPEVRRTVLPNGVRVLSETIPSLRSVAIGIWVESGSRYDLPARGGLAHFLEHLVFKGTTRRTAAQIAEEIDAVGGVLNASTDREHTCYYAKVLGADLGLAIDLLSDLILQPRLDPEEIARERNVVLEEIAQIEDTPDDYVQDLFHLAYWPDHPLGRPICGTRASVEAIERADCLDVLARRYRPDRLLVAVAGHVEHDRLVAEIEARFGDLVGTAALETDAPARSQAGVTLHPRALEQVQLYLGTRGLPAADPARAAAVVLNTALGDGASSRLFQEVRERRGRAYAIESFLCSYRDSGYLGVAAGMRPRWAREVVETVLVELARVRREGFAPADLARAKGKLRGTLELALETSDQRMERLALDEIYLGGPMPIAERTARIEAVTNDDVVAVAGRMFDRAHCGVVLLGDVGTDHLDPDVLEALA